MQCNACNTPLPPGVAYCPTCGASTAYNVSGSDPYAPSTLPSPYGAPSPQPMPPTNYGAQNNPYGYSTYPQPQAQQNPYGMPQQNPVPPAYGIPPVYAPPPQPRRSNTGLIITGLIIGLVLLTCGGCYFAGRNFGSNIPTTTTSSSFTPTTSNSDSVPSSQSIVPSASNILANLQLSSSIDKDYQPTHITSTFTTLQTVYATFDIDSHGQPGYIQAKWYGDNELLKTSQFSHSPQNTVGYFQYTYDAAASGVVGLYWCTTASCSDAQLAQVKSFTVTD